MFTEKYRSALENYEKFWRHESIGRPIVSVRAPKSNAKFRDPVSLEEKWLDEEYVCARIKFQNENTYHTGDSTPSFLPNMGPGVLAACIGGSFELAPSTVWFDRHPIIDDMENIPPLRFDTESEMWQHIMRLQNRMLEEPDANVMIVDIGGVLDIAASLRSTETLLYDLYDYPEEVKSLCSRITDMWIEAFDLQVANVSRSGLPYNNWHEIPSSLPWYPLQCDFCAMISPAQFEEFVLGDLVRLANHMPRSIYHLDGPDAVRHLDMLLDIDNLTGIQWQNGAGQPPYTDECWFDMYRRIQDKKKNIVLRGVNAYNEPALERLVKSFDPAGFYMVINCRTPDDADRTLEKICAWSEKN